MNILEAAKEYATLVNSLALVLLLLKFASDARKQRLENIKLERELRELRERETEAVSKVLSATATDLNRLVIGPLIESIRKRDQEVQDNHRRLLEAFYSAATSVHEQAERRDRELQDGHRRVLDAFYGAAASIREQTEKAGLGSKLSALIRENTRALDQLRDQFGLPAEHRNVAQRAVKASLDDAAE